MLSDRPEVELLPMRPIASVTVSQAEYMFETHDFSSPVDGDARRRHEAQQFIRTARLMLHDAAAGDLHDLEDYMPMEPPC